jgi:hypothetical protein
MQAILRGKMISLITMLLLLNCIALSSSMATKPFVIGTRGSPLALAQAYETKRLLGVNFPEFREEGSVEIKKIMTKVFHEF